MLNYMFSVLIENPVESYPSKKVQVTIKVGLFFSEILEIIRGDSKGLSLGLSLFNINIIDLFLIDQ